MTSDDYMHADVRALPGAGSAAAQSAALLASPACLDIVREYVARFVSKKSTLMLMLVSLHQSMHENMHLRM